MKVAWTQNALFRLQQIHDHIAFDQPGNAKNFIDKLTRKAELIAFVPHGGRVVPEYSREDIRETYEGEYRIIYRIRRDRPSHGATVVEGHWETVTLKRAENGDIPNF